MKRRCAYVRAHRPSVRTCEETGGSAHICGLRRHKSPTWQRVVWGQPYVHKVACVWGEEVCVVWVSFLFIYFFEMGRCWWGFATCRGILSAVRGGLVNMQRTSKLNQTAKLSIFFWGGNVTRAWKWHHWKVSRLQRAPYPWAFLASVQLCAGEVANFACKFQSISSSEASQDISKRIWQ